MGPGFYGAGARCTADGGKTLIVKLVVRHIVGFDVGPHLVSGPGRERAEFLQAVGGVPFSVGKTGAGDRLLLA